MYTNNKQQQQKCWLHRLHLLRFVPPESSGKYLDSRTLIFHFYTNQNTNRLLKRSSQTSYCDQSHCETLSFSPLHPPSTHTNTVPLNHLAPVYSLNTCWCVETFPPPNWFLPILVVYKWKSSTYQSPPILSHVLSYIQCLLYILAIHTYHWTTQHPCLSLWFPECILTDSSHSQSQIYLATVSVFWISPNKTKFQQHGQILQGNLTHFTIWVHILNCTTKMKVSADSHQSYPATKYSISLCTISVKSIN